MVIKYQKSSKFIYFILFVILLSATFGLILLINHTSNIEGVNLTSYSLNLSENNDFNLTAFWNKEVEIRINTTDLNIELSNNFTLELHQKDFIAREIVFDSPNFVNAFPSKIRIDGYLIYPNNIKSDNPGALVMHGLNGLANQSFDMAYYYLERGFITLCHSHPGHGKSEGAVPSRDNFYFQQEFNESSHFYLTTCAAIQALRVLENLTIVNNSQIIVTGGSYGALTTMWLSGVIGSPRIKAAIPVGAAGDFETNLEDPTKLIFWLLGMPANEIPESFWTNQLKRIDPKYYLENPNLPPIFFKMGTTDEFFYHRCINDTFNAVPHTTKYLQIYPNYHHTLPGYDNTTAYFLDYVMNGGLSPPNIDIIHTTKNYGLIGDTFEVILGPVGIDIESAQIYYRYLNIPGSKWEAIEMVRNYDFYCICWEATINPGIINSEIDFFIKVQLKGEQGMWFTSQLYTTGMIISNFTIPFYIFFILGIVIPAMFLIRQRFRKNLRDVDKEKKIKAKKYLIIELISIGVIESLFFLSLSMPWIVLEGGIIWTHDYIFNNIFTWEQYFGIATSFLTVLFIIGWIFYALLSIMKPILTGFLQIGYPILAFIIFSFYIARLSSPTTSSSAQLFGTGYPGLGIFLMLFCAIAIILLGIWKRKYQTKLGLRAPKTKWYNIDRWLRINKSKSRKT